MKAALEAVMLICFGISWPFSIVRSLKSRTAAGKSPVFLIFIIIGYVCGIAAKISGGEFFPVGILYVADMLMVITDLLIYFRNRRLDKLRLNK